MLDEKSLKIMVRNKSVEDGEVSDGKCLMNEAKCQEVGRRHNNVGEKRSSPKALTVERYWSGSINVE